MNFTNKPNKLKFFIFIMGFFSIFSLFSRCAKKSNYHISGGQWYFKDVPVNASAANSFKVLNDVFATDELSGYYRGEEINGSEGKSFTAMDTYYAKDRSTVYYCETYRKGQEYFLNSYNSITKLIPANLESFSSVGEGYAKDSQSVYFQGKPFYVADPINFKLLELDFAKDGLHGYYACKEIKGSKAGSFEVISEHYAKDESSVWYVERDYSLKSVFIAKLNTASPNSFVVEGFGYSTDEKHVFYRDSLIRIADAKSFHRVEGQVYDAKDSLNYYLEGKLSQKK